MVILNQIQIVKNNPIMNHFSIKKLLLNLFIPFMILSCVNGQDVQKIDSNQFKKFALNDKITLKSLINVAGDWQTLKEQLGQPTEQRCEERDPILGFEPTCTFQYSGLVINYTDVGNGIELATAELTNSEAFLSYENIKLRVGTSILKLQDLFPEAYQKRRSVTNNDVTRHFIQLNIKNSDTYLSFQYSMSTNKVTRIKLLRIIT